METYLVIARNESGQEIATAEVRLSGDDNILEMAQSFLGAVDTVQQLYHEPAPECCEVWYRDHSHSMTLIATVY